MGRAFACLGRPVDRRRAGSCRPFSVGHLLATTTTSGGCSTAALSCRDSGASNAPVEIRSPEEEMTLNHRNGAAGLFAAALAMTGGAAVADTELPGTMVWTAYDLGSDRKSTRLNSSH